MYSDLPDIIVKYLLKICLFILFFIVVEDAHGAVFKGNSKQTIWRGYLVCYFKLSVFLEWTRIKVRVIKLFYFKRLFSVYFFSKASFLVLMNIDLSNLNILF